MFHTQSPDNFQMRFDPMIYIHEGSGLLYLHLPPIDIKTNVENFGFMIYKSGPKPSKEIDLGFVYQNATSNHTYRCAWRTDGKIILQSAVTSGDYLHPASFVVPIPDGVTFA